MNSILTSIGLGILAFTACVIVIPRDVSGFAPAGNQAHGSMSRVKRGSRDENVPPPAGLFPFWAPPTTPDRNRWLIFPFPTRPGKSTTRAPTTTKMPTPPTPAHPPIPSFERKSTTFSTQRLTSPDTTTGRPSTIVTTQKEKTTVSTTKIPLTTMTEVSTTEADTTTKKSTTASTTHAPTTTIPGLLKVDNCFRPNSRAHYDINVNTASGPPVLTVRLRSIRLRRYFAKCQIQVLSVEEWTLKTFQAQFSKEDNRCIFSLSTLLPNTEFLVRVKMEANRGVVIPHMIKWSATYRGFKSGDYVPEKDASQPIRTSREKTTIMTTQRPVTTTPIGPTLPPECQDYSIKCRGYAARGGCKRNPDFMENNCRRSCPKLCVNYVLRKAARSDQNVCVDMEKRKCGFWEKQTFCWQSDYGLKALMTDYCRKTCNLCEKKRVVFKAECRDKYRFPEHCKAWARQGTCKRNPVFMYRNCLKSCGRCSYLG